MGGFKKLSKKKIGLTYFMILGLLLSVYAEYPFFFIGIIELMSQNHEEIITDPLKFKNDITIAFVISYFLIPIFTYFLLNGAFNEFKKKKLDASKNLNDYPFGFLILMLLAFVFSSVYTIILNNHLL